MRPEAHPFDLATSAREVRDVVQKGGIAPIANSYACCNQMCVYGYVGPTISRGKCHYRHRSS